MRSEVPAIDLPDLPLPTHFINHVPLATREESALRECSPVRGGGTWTRDTERVSEAYKEAMGALADGVAAVLPGAQLSASTGM